MNRNGQRRTAVPNACPSRDYCRRVLQRRGPFCLRKCPFSRLFDFRLIDGRACSPLWPPSHAGHRALRDACIYGETTDPGENMTRPGWPSVVVESCTPATVRLLTYGRTSRIYPSVKFARNHPMLTRCRASVTRQRNSFVTSRSSSFR